VRLIWTGWFLKNKIEKDVWRRCDIDRYDIHILFVSIAFCSTIHHTTTLCTHNTTIPLSHSPLSLYLSSLKNPFLNFQFFYSFLQQSIFKLFFCFEIRILLLLICYKLRFLAFLQNSPKSHYLWIRHLYFLRTCTLFSLSLSLRSPFGTLSIWSSPHSKLWNFWLRMEKYELVKDIGSGNFGVARLMRHKETKELVAMKYIERGHKVLLLSLSLSLFLILKLMLLSIFIIFYNPKRIQFKLRYISGFISLSFYLYVRVGCDWVYWYVFSRLMRMLPGKS